MRLNHLLPPAPAVDAAVDLIDTVIKLWLAKNLNLKSWQIAQGGKRIYLSDVSLVYIKVAVISVNFAQGVDYDKGLLTVSTGLFVFPLIPFLIGTGGTSQSPQSR